MASLWRNRDFVLLWSGQTASTLGTRASAFAFPLLVLTMTGSQMLALAVLTLLVAAVATASRAVRIQSAPAG